MLSGQQIPLRPILYGLTIHTQQNLFKSDSYRCFHVPHYISRVFTTQTTMQDSCRGLLGCDAIGYRRFGGPCCLHLSHWSIEVFCTCCFEGGVRFSFVRGMLALCLFLFLVPHQTYSVKSR